MAQVKRLKLLYTKWYRYRKVGLDNHKRQTKTMVGDQNKDRLCRFMSRSILVFDQSRVNLPARGRAEWSARAVRFKREYLQEENFI